jgi:AsmA protein
LCDNGHPVLYWTDDMRALRLVGFVIGSFVVLLILLLLAVRLLVDPNDYKGRIAQAVKSSTGRELTLSGPIKLSVFPWLALEIGPASLGNPAGFSAEPFAAVRHASFRVKLLPLLRKQLEIGKVEIEGLDLRLRKNAAGKGNWQDFGQHETAAETGSSRSNSGGAFPDLAGISVKDSRLSYQDLVADHINLELGHIGTGKPVPLKLRLDLTTSSGAKPLDISLSVPELSLDLTAQTLAAPQITADLAAARLDAALQGEEILDAPNISGSFKLNPVSLRDLMGELGIQPPTTRDPQALGKFAAGGKFTYHTNTASAQDLQIQLDDSTLRGAVSVDNLTTKATRFELGIDRINMDRYRSPPDTAPSPTARPARKDTNGAAEPAASDVFKTLDLNGTLKIADATVAGLRVSQVLVTIAARNGLTHIAPAKAKLYGGSYVGEITLDDRGTTPTLQLDQNMTGIDVAQLMKDLAKSQRISGRGTVTTNLTAHGLAGEALLKTLDGHVAADLDNGAIEGIDLWFEINRAMALIQKQPLPTGNSSGRTKFDVFKASADLTHGIASTRDLSIASQNLRVTGQGTTNLVTDGINYQVKATILKDAGGKGGTLADIPLNITGTLSSPNVRPDLEGMAKARVQQEIDKHKGELQQKLMDKLKDFLK